MASPSFKRINYAIRTNKNIERKLVFERLASLSHELDLSSHRYVGFGSMWFVDFVLAHRLLGTSEMWSIEQDDADRAEFNKPYSCIEVKHGHSRDVLAAMNDAEWAERAIVWLDYDGVFDTDARDDCKQLLVHLAVGSVLLVSVNAKRTNYSNLHNSQTSENRLHHLMGNAVPVRAIRPGEKDITRAAFPDVLAESLSNWMASSVQQSGRETNELPDRFVPLFRFVHKDTVEIVTVGGVIVSSEQLDRMSSSLGHTAEAMVRGEAALRDCLDLAPITIKEKLAMDRLLPCPEPDFLAGIPATGVRLDQREISKYHRLYKQFPLFVEVLG